MVVESDVDVFVQRVFAAADRHRKNNRLTVSELRTYLSTGPYRPFMEFLVGERHSSLRGFKRADENFDGVLDKTEIKQAAIEYFATIEYQASRNSVLRSSSSSRYPTHSVGSSRAMLNSTGPPPSVRLHINGAREPPMGEVPSVIVGTLPCLLEDASRLLGVPARKLFTLEGKEIRRALELANLTDLVVASSVYASFKPPLYLTARHEGNYPYPSEHRRSEASIAAQRRFGDVNERAAAIRAKMMIEAMDTNKDGVVDLEEFVEGGGKEEEFSQYDLDANGTLDADELELMALAKARARQDSAVMDTNQDGVVDEEEYKYAGGKEADFSRYDVDDSGALDNGELELMAACKGKAKHDMATMDANQDGVVSREEFEEGGGKGGDFEVYDFDGSHALNEDELEHMAAAKGLAKQSMKKMDENNDGVIDVREFEEGGGEHFERYDTDGNRVLDEQEIEVMHAVQGKAKQEMRRMDKNKDGLVDKEEFSGGGGKDFELYDVNDSGALDKDAMERMLVSQVHTRQLQNEVDKNRDGVVDRKEWEEAGGVGADFEFYDDDASGTLTKNELEVRSLAKAKAREDMWGMDGNRDGVLTEEEFVRGGGNLKADFDRYDTDRDGVLDEVELEKMAATKAKVRLMTSKYDSNRDGVLDREEFANAGFDGKDFDRYDANKDGKLDAGELEVLQLTKGHTRAVKGAMQQTEGGEGEGIGREQFRAAGGKDDQFDEYDKDGNGTLDSKEFEAFMADAIANNSDGTALARDAMRQQRRDAQDVGSEVTGLQQPHSTYDRKGSQFGDVDSHSARGSRAGSLHGSELSGSGHMVKASGNRARSPHRRCTTLPRSEIREAGWNASTRVNRALGRPRANDLWDRSSGPPLWQRRERPSTQRRRGPQYVDSGYRRHEGSRGKYRLHGSHVVAI